MMIVFAGTKDGRDHVKKLIDDDEKVIVCTATSYGASLYPEHENIIKKYHHPMDIDEMKRIIEQHKPEKIVDATHPYALNVSENIKNAAKSQSVEVERLDRESLLYKYKSDVVAVESYGEAVKHLEMINGNILLTIGSRNLEFFKEVDNKEKLFLRVLPMKEVIEKCENLGFLPNRILALQGPFSQKMNEVIYDDYDIECLVTKDSGKTGGMEEKIIPALEKDITVIIIKRKDDK
ncbi:MAG: precorrin-6A reductase [Bacillota bacterium]|nr:precorrin-6A reductase [Bacillota bacterium]